MARQNIYGTISDDVAGQRGHTSSQRGKVKTIDVWINTDTAGASTIQFDWDAEKQKVIVRGTVPDRWDVKLKRVRDVI